jgi:hypothetical protein
VWIGIEEKELDMGKVKEIGVLYDKLAISSPVNAEIITFPEEEWTVIQDTFNFPNLDLLGTNLSGIMFYPATKEIKVDKSPKVLVTSWNGKLTKESVVELTERILLPLFGKKIVISVPHGAFSAENKNPEEFHIRIWSQEDVKSPDPLFRGEIPQSFWGIPINNKDGFFIPTGKGLVIEDETGFPVAELLDHTLFIHHDIAHHGDPESIKNQLGILQHIYEAVIYMRANPEEYEKKKAEREIMAFARLMNLSIEKKLLNTIKQIQKLSKSSEEYRGYLVTTERELVSYLKEKNFLESPGNKVNDSEVKRRWNDIHSIKEIQNVTLKSGSLIEFDVGVIQLEYNEETYEVGPFHITLDFNSSRIKVTSSGQRSTRGSHIHPHASSDGLLCYGNLGDTITAAMVNYEFDVLITLILELLHNYTNSDAYEPLVYFKPMTKKGINGKETK